MRKYILLVSVLLALGCADASAQGLLGKMKEKAQAAASAAAKGVGNIADFAKSQVSEERRQHSAADVDAVEAIEEDEEDSPLSSLREQKELTRKSTSMCSWDEAEITPSSTKVPGSLLNELPELPAIAELVSPSEEKQKAYYMAIKRVTMRAEMLNDDETCNEETEKLWKNKYLQNLKDTYGFTDAEIAMLDRGDLTEAEQQALANKVLAKAMGGIDMNTLAKLQEMENMSEAERDAAIRQMAGGAAQSSMSAIFQVIDRYKQELPKYLGITADEYKEQSATIYQLAMSGDEKKSEELGKKMQAKSEAYRKTLPADQQKASRAFEQKLQQELQSAMMQAYTPAFAAPGSAAGKEPTFDFGTKLSKYYEDLAKIMPRSSSDAKRDAAFSAEDSRKVEELRKKIFATDDPAVYNPLFVEAIQLITTYRERAAKVWRADLAKRIESVKTAVPQVLKLNRQAIEDGIIPECALYRDPLNMVIEAGDILCDAYSEFPSDYPALYEEEVTREVRLKSGEYFFWPEFYVVNSVEDLLKGKSIYKQTDDGCIYQLNGNSWVRMDNMKPKDKKLAGTESPEHGSWTSSDGKRTVTYVAEGNYLLLPEGEEVHPLAFEKQGNSLVWVCVNMGQKKAQIIKCTYKL